MNTTSGRVMPDSVAEAVQILRWGTTMRCALTGEPCVGRGFAIGFLIGALIVGPVVRLGRTIGWKTPLVVAVVVWTSIVSLATGHTQVMPVAGTVYLEDGDTCTDRGYVRMLCDSGRVTEGPFFGEHWSMRWQVIADGAKLDVVGCSGHPTGTFMFAPPSIVRTTTGEVIETPSPNAVQPLPCDLPIDQWCDAGRALALQLDPTDAPYLPTCAGATS